MGQIDNNKKEFEVKLELTKVDQNNLQRLKDEAEKLKDEAESKFEEFKRINSEKIDKISEYEKETKQAAEEVDAMKREVEAMKVSVTEADRMKNEEIQKAGAALGDKLGAEMEQWRLDEEVKSL